MNSLHILCNGRYMLVHPPACYRSLSDPSGPKCPRETPVAGPWGSQVNEVVSVPFQRTPWGGGKRGGRKTSRMTPPPKRGFGPPSYSTPLRCQCSVFLYTPRQSRTEALLEGSKNNRESAFSGTFSSTHTFCTPPYHGPIIGHVSRT